MKYWEWQFTCGTCGYRSRWYPYEWMANVASRWHYATRFINHLKKYSRISARSKEVSK